MKKRTFTTVERMLVHLSTEALRPEERTQEGIAAATRSGRSTLTKWLDRMERRGLVRRTRIRVDGHPLPKYAYRLTESGWRMASDLRRRLGTEVVRVRAPRLGELAVRMSEVPSLASARLGLAAAVAAVRKGKLDLTRASRPLRGRGPQVWGNGLRRVDRFFGRTEELRDLDRWFASGSSAVLITGLAGIGKSALAAAWVQSRRLATPVYGFEIHRSTTPAGLLTDFGTFLALLGKPALASYLSQGVPLDIAFLTRLLERDLRRQPILVVLDNADQASRNLAQVVDALLVRGMNRFPARVVFIGRKIPRWLRTSRRGGSRVEVRQVQGLDVTSSKALLSSRGLLSDGPGAGEIVRRTRGHPLLLHFAATSGSPGRTGAQQYLEDEVWNTLSAPERSVLEAGSLFRKPVSDRILEHVAGADHQVLERLSERSLLDRTVGDRYSLHDVVKAFVARRIPADRRVQLHRRAADVLLMATEPRERWEGVYHLMEAGQTAEAARILDSEGSALLDCVAAEEIAPLARNIRLEEASPGPYCSFAEVLGDSLRIRGHIGPALFQYEHARRLAENARLTERVPRLLRKMAFLERCRNHYALALGYLVEAQARLSGSADSTEKTDVFRELALVAQTQGNLLSASSYLSQAIDLATETSDRGALARALLALGSLETRQGHPERGLDYGMEGLRVAERSGNLTEIAHAHIVVGTTLEELERFTESLQHHEMGLRLARVLGNLRLTAYASMNRTGTLILLRRLKEASDSLQETQGLFGIIEERDAAALLKTYEGQLHMALGHWTRAREALDVGIRELRRYGSPADLALALKETGGFYADHGESTVGRQRLLEAREIALKLSNARLLSEIEDTLNGLGVLPPHGSAT